jgi:hypothetical protein
LSGLINKYLTVEAPFLLLLNDEVIDENSLKLLIDENFVLKIIVTQVDNKQLNLIRVLTRTEKNLKWYNRLMIR